MSAQIDDGGPAFPATCSADGIPLVVSYPKDTVSGMTLRDWFAGKCDTQSYNPSRMFFDQFGRHATPAEFAEYISTIRYLEAGDMIEARKGGKQ